MIAGDALLEANYPAVHAVGRAAVPDRAPRMIEISWGDAADAPLVALVGKGVVFDTGGLDIKPSAGMRLMKKDMGGAAHALALAPDGHGRGAAGAAGGAGPGGRERHLRRRHAAGRRARPRARA